MKRSKQTAWTKEMIADAKWAAAVCKESGNPVRLYHARGWTGDFPWHLI